MAFEAEIKELQKKVAQNPASLVFAPLADTLRKAGRLDEAVEACLAGLEQNPSYMTARVILGRTYAEKGMLEEAISEFKKITLADAGNIMAHSMLGQMYTRRSQFGEAIEEYQRVLALNPDDAGTQAALEEALSKARELPGGAPAAEPAAKKAEPARRGDEDKLATITVAEIYIKKGALDEAVEVFREILQADPGNKIAKAKLEEIVALKEKKGQEESASEQKRKAEEDARARQAMEEKRKAEEAAKRAAEEDEKQKALLAASKLAAAAAEEKRKADEAEKQAAEAEEKRKADEAAQRAAAESEGKRKAEEAEQKAVAEAEEKRKAEEAERKAAAEAEEKRKAEDAMRRAAAEADQKRKAEEAMRRAAEEADQKRKAAEESERKRKDDEEGGEKITAEDIFSVMKMSSPDEVIDEDNGPKGKPAAPAKAAGAEEALISQIRAFAKANGILASLLVARDGAVMDAQIPSGVDGKALGQLTVAIFGNTEKAVSRMRYGSLNQLIITGEDGRQILFVQLKQGVLAALTDKNVNLGLLRIALHDLLRKAQS